MNLMDHSFFCQFSPEVGAEIRNLVRLVEFHDGEVIFQHRVDAEALGRLLSEGTLLP